MIQEAEHWAPFVAHVVAIVQGMLAIIRKPEKPPTAAEIADQVTSRMNVDNPNMAMTYDPVIAQRIARVTLALYEPSAEK
jgi:hypothetical protein